MTAAVPESAPEKILLDVPFITQRGGYPTGCEPVTAVMALNYAGLDITVDEFIDSCLPMAPNPPLSPDGKTYVGQSPFKFFLGNPRRENSLGCMSPVIEFAMRKALKDFPAEVRGEAGRTLSGLCEDYVAAGVPVIIWATLNMLPPRSGGIIKFRDGTGRFRWVRGEHCLLLLGMDEKNYYFNDPWTGKAASYPKALVEKRYDFLGRQAIVVLKKSR